MAFVVAEEARLKEPLSSLLFCELWYFNEPAVCVVVSVVGLCVFVDVSE